MVGRLNSTNRLYLKGQSNGEHLFLLHITMPLLFINKTAKSQHLGHSNDTEGVEIRSFVQSHNRRKLREQRARKLSVIPYGGASAASKQDVKGEKKVADPALLAAAARPAFVLREPSQHPGFTTAEIRSSSYFLQCMIGVFTAKECVSFWHFLLPQLSASSSLIRSTMTGMSYLHEACTTTAEDTGVMQTKGLIQLHHAIDWLRQTPWRPDDMAADLVRILVISMMIFLGDKTSAEGFVDAYARMAGIVHAEIINSRLKRPLTDAEVGSPQRTVQGEKARCIEKRLKMLTV